VRVASAVARALLYPMVAAGRPPGEPPRKIGCGYSRACRAIIVRSWKTLSNFWAAKHSLGVGLEENRPLDDMGIAPQPLGGAWAGRPRGNGGGGETVDFLESGSLGSAATALGPGGGPSSRAGVTAVSFFYTIQFGCGRERFWRLRYITRLPLRITVGFPRRLMRIGWSRRPAALVRGAWRSQPGKPPSNAA
jgi:hypothetical protein